MATTQTPSSTLPTSLSAHDRFLIKATEDALRDGIQLERWARDPGREISKFPLLLSRPFNKPFKLKNEAFGYFGNVSVSGNTLPAVGLLQTIQFSKICPQNPEE